LNPLILVGLAYLAGAIPTSFWIGKVGYDVDLRTEGSGNLGATNTFRVLGWKAAFPVVVVDVAKGFVPVWWFPLLDTSPDVNWAIAYGGASVVGHVFSIWVAFRGGKGVATSTGVLAALAPSPVLAAFVVWMTVVWTTRMVSLGSIVGALAVPIAAWGMGSTNAPLQIFLWTLAAFVAWSHRANIVRIIQKREPRFGKGPVVTAPRQAAHEQEELAE